jgi:hypothetical protein
MEGTAVTHQPTNPIRSHTDHHPHTASTHRRTQPRSHRHSRETHSIVQLVRQFICKPLQLQAVHALGGCVCAARLQPEL